MYESVVVICVMGICWYVPDGLAAISHSFARWNKKRRERHERRNAKRRRRKFDGAGAVLGGDMRESGSQALIYTCANATFTARRKTRHGSTFGDCLVSANVKQHSLLMDM